MKPKSIIPKKLLLTAVIFAAFSPLFGQSLSLQGVVKDAGGAPMIGVTVIVGQTGNGTSTDNRGEFKISAKVGEKLNFSMLGYTDTEVAVVASQKFYEVTMTDNSLAIEDVVIIGYGEVGKKDVTGMVSTVSNDEIIKSPALGLDQAIQGRVAGVQINSADGQPGIETEMVIRGANSLTQNNNPLYVVDGFPMEDFSLSSINNNDIKSFSILKDASATAIYGSRGANGVVIIETKQGDVGRPKITYNGTIGMQSVTKKMEMMSAYEYVKYQIELNPSYEARYLADEDLTLDDYRSVEATDWQDQLFSNAPINKHNISISGGTTQTKYNVSFSYTDQNGVISNSGYTRYQGKAALTQQISDNLRLKVNMTYFEDNRQGQLASSALDTSTGYQTYLMYRTWAFRPITLKNYQYYDDLDESDEDEEYSTMYDGNTLNPIVSNNNEKKDVHRSSLVSNARLEWEIADGLKFATQGGINRRTSVYENFYNSKTYNGRNRASNAYGVNADYRNVALNEWVNENTLTYRKKFDVYHKFDVLLGFTMQGSATKSYGYKTIEIPNEGLGMSGMDDGTLFSATASASSNRLMSYLARANYSYKSRYLFTASFRADGSSKFSKQNRWGYFPSGAFAWRLSDERFMRRVKFISEAKLRASYGLTGNNRINEYSRYAYMTAGDYYSYGNTTPFVAYGIGGIGNDDLKWETTEQYDLGLDLSLFKDRINIVFDLYRKTTRDLLLNANISATAGVSTVYKNIGSVRNDGLEFSINTVNIKTRRFVWTTDFNICLNRSKVLSLSDDQTQMLTMVSWTGNFNATPLYITQVDGPLTAFYGFVFDGLYQISDFDVASDGTYVLKSDITTNGNDSSTIQPGHTKYRDINGDGQITDADRVVIGRAEPLHTGGINNVFTYKNWELSVFLQWSYGNMVMNANRIIFEGNQSDRPINQFASYADRYIVGDESTYSSQNHAVRGGGPLGYYSTRTLEDGSYLRLKTVQLLYNIPKSWLSRYKIEKMQIFLAGQNLGTLTGYTGLDPEVSTKSSALTPGFDYSAYARNRIITAGVNIIF